MALLLLASSCSSSGGDAVATSAATPITTAPPASVAPVATDAPTTVAPPVTTVPVDAAAVLQAALDSLAPGYHFTTTVTVNGAVAVSADGDRVADGTRLMLSNNGADLAYVITPQGTWVQPADGTWEPLDTPPANADPIAALRAPNSVTVTASDGTTTQLTVIVPVLALGIPGAADATAEVSLTITGGALTTMSYATAIGGSPATVQASLGAIVDGSPVVAPA